jgi:hypothetical protein
MAVTPMISYLLSKCAAGFRNTLLTTKRAEHSFTDGFYQFINLSGYNMLLKSIALAAMIVVSGSALADTQKTIALTGSGAYLTANFGDTDLVAGTFTDTFTFTVTPADLAGKTDLYFFNRAFSDVQSVSFTGASINGVTVPVSYGVAATGSVPHYSFGSLSPTLLSGNLVLTISGIAGGAASYAGTINLTTVPEPATYGMMLGGLAMLGFMARRRKQD